MNTKAEELHRIISASLRDMLDSYRIQMAAGPVTDETLKEILFRAARYPGQQQIALLPSVVRIFP